MKKFFGCILAWIVALAAVLPASVSAAGTDGTVTYTTNQGRVTHRLSSTYPTPSANSKPWWGGTIVVPDAPKGSFTVREGEQLSTVTKAHPELLEHRPQGQAVTAAAGPYPTCSWYMYSPCMQSSSPVIDSVGGVYYGYDDIAPRETAPCPPLSAAPCDLSGNISGTFSGSISETLTIGPEKVQSATGLSVSVSVTLSYTTTIHVPPGKTGVLGPQLNFQKKDYWSHQDNFVCTVDYDPMGSPYYNCNYYSTTYGSGTIKQVTSQFNWYQDIY